METANDFSSWVPWLILWASIITNVVLAMSVVTQVKKVQRLKSVHDAMYDTATQYYHDMLQARDEIIEAGKEIVKQKAIVKEYKEMLGNGEKYYKNLEKVILRNGWELPMG